MEEALTVDKLIKILTKLSDDGYGSKPIGLETLSDITLCLNQNDVYYEENYDGVVISTTNI